MDTDRTLDSLLRAIEGVALAHQDFDASCLAVLDEAAAALGAAGAWIQHETFDREPGALFSAGVPAACRLAAGRETPWPAGAAARVQPELMEIAAAAGPPGSLPAALRECGFASVTFVPVGARGRLLGALALLSRERRERNAQEERVAAGFARVAATALVRERLRASHRSLESEILRTRRFENVGHVAGGVAHDFNNMLTAMIGYMDLVSAGLPPGAEEQSYVTQALEAAEQATELTRQLLAFARRQPEAPAAQNLNTVLERISPLVRRLMPENVNLVTEARAAHAWVMGDPGQIEQVAMSLALRARDALPGGGALALAVIEIPDAGGVPAEVALEATDSSECDDEEPLRLAIGPPESAGDDDRDLRLAFAASLVHAGGGRMEAGRLAGGGVRVRAVWPLTGTPGARPAAGGAPRGLETVLFVEDDPSMRDLVAAMLRRLGYDALTAGGAEEALGLLARRQGGVGLLVADLVLPGMSGRDLALRAREAQPGLRVLLTSGYAVSPGATEVAGGLPFLPKPFSIDALARRVRETLDAPPAGAGDAPV